MRAQRPCCVQYRIRACMPLEGKPLRMAFMFPNHDCGSEIKVNAIYLFFLVIIISISVTETI